MLIKFSEEAQKILKNAKEEMLKLHHPFIGSEHVLLSILNSDNEISKELKKNHINYKLFREELIKKIGYGSSDNNYFIYTPLLKRILENAIIDAKESELKEISIHNIFTSILDEGEGVANRILMKMGLNIDKLYDELNHCYNIKNSNRKLLINECSVDLNKDCQSNNSNPLIGRDKEVDEIINILLRRNKNNPLLIGEAGVGKTAIVEELSRRIVNGNVPEKLLNKRILSLSMASCVAGTKYRGEFEEKITKIIKELETNDDIILFIDEIHTIVGAGGAEGAIDASNIFKPALARGHIKVIGATTIKEYKETINKDKALNRRFQTVFINENTKEETMDILLKLKTIYEEYHQVIIKDEIIEEIVKLTDKYITDKSNPDKSIDILDMVCTKVALKRNKKNIELEYLKERLDSIKNRKNQLIIKHHYSEASKLKKYEMEVINQINLLALAITKEKRKIIKISDVKEIIETKTRIPVYNLKNNKLINIEQSLKKKIVGQDEAISVLSKETKRIMLGLKDNLPCSFLFVGPSGVGKTMLVKEYSKYLNIPLIRLDMSEYKESSSISKIIGSAPGYIGYNDMDNVIEKIRNNPFCILLLDEIEKACKEVINLFLQVLDEGIITDSHGIKTNLRNVIIIMTSNIGSEKNHIGFTKIENNYEILDILSTALVNRISSICYFNRLTKENVITILNNRIKELQKIYSEYTFKINNDQINDILTTSNIEVFGVRKALKILDDKIEDIILNNMLNKKKILL